MQTFDNWALYLQLNNSSYDQRWLLKKKLRGALKTVSINTVTYIHSKKSIRTSEVVKWRERAQIDTFRRCRSDLKCSRCSCSESNSAAQVLHVHLDPEASESCCCCCCCCWVVGGGGGREGSDGSTAEGGVEGWARRRTDESKKSEASSKRERGSLFSGAAAAI